MNYFFTIIISLTCFSNHLFSQKNDSIFYNKSFWAVKKYIQNGKKLSHKQLKSVCSIYPESYSLAISAYKNHFTGNVFFYTGEFFLAQLISNLAFSNSKTKIPIELNMVFAVGFMSTGHFFFISRKQNAQKAIAIYNKSL